ncbi:hypothetical protein GPECTOR_20g456 [Gonium pectorale]|uniref:Uncharacterized protein n=1 Tax=Gonium pectorale TaxID=33097 RepID=A0A150GJG3_GONPE|nr:hypothetical protein GPECTOR_20g456 [Gonium pectorale]|eukprot:KXZ49600.1 hypothetical protein GPECTOR_20g456 [Gonium pectorale]
MVRDKIRWISDQVPSEFHESKLRVAFVGYRDYGDSPAVEVIDFTPLSAGTFRQYGDCSGDSYPGGDKLGRSGAAILQKLRIGCGISAYSFAHLNGSTRKMLHKFGRECGDPAWVREDDFKDVSGLPLKVSVSACHTQLPSTAALLAAIRNKLPLGTEDNRAIRLRIAPQPFSPEGATRWPFFAREADATVGTSSGSSSESSGGRRLLVVKRFKVLARPSQSQVHTRARYVEQKEVQAVSAALTAEFNREAAATGVSAKHVSFSRVTQCQVAGWGSTCPRAGAFTK